mmetsp:Transcript_33153/g.35724  ORF Transcript_33153/g.35724 Transcript_33153/m.35724 type:complete len:95 (+) Transcript_33153:107-391(+)
MVIFIVPAKIYKNPRPQTNRKTFKYRTKRLRMRARKDMGFRAPQARTSKTMMRIHKIVVWKAQIPVGIVQYSSSVTRGYNVEVKEAIADKKAKT